MENANLWSIILFGDLFSINDYDNNDYETKEIYQKLLKTLNNTLINKVAELQKYIKLRGQIRQISLTTHCNIHFFPWGLPFNSHTDAVDIEKQNSTSP